MRASLSFLVLACALTLAFPSLVRAEQFIDVAAPSAVADWPALHDTDGAMGGGQWLPPHTR
mgnify:CR=1 FL=1